MRLTLRTLLAHKDGVLDRSDAELLESKIRESQLANTLRQRIDACMRRRHLGAPALDGRGLGGDPNSVAEYLDNTLSQERISEFERVCLESDVQLAEVAACHQVLTIVLEQPATITPSLRSRIQLLEKADTKTLAAAGVNIRRRGEQYSRIDPAHSESRSKEPSTSETSGHLTDSARASKQPDTIRKQGIDLSDRELTNKVPEYLRGRSSQSWKQVAFTVALLGLLLLLSWQTVGSLDNLKSLWKGSESSSDPRTEEKKSDSNGSNASAPNGNLPERANGGGAVPVVANEAKKGPEAAETDVPKGTSVEVPTADTTPSNVPPEIKSDVPALKVVEPSKPIVGRWLPETLTASEAVVFWSNSDNLLEPRRSAVGESFPAGARINVPPAFNTEIRLEPGILWTVAGATDIRLLENSNGSFPRVELMQTKAILRASEKAKQIELVLDAKRSIMVEFVSPSSIAGVELRHYWNPGAPLSDPSQVPGVFQIMALEEDLRCSLIVNGKQEGSPVPVPFGSAFGWVEGTPPITFNMTSTPKWLSSMTQAGINMYTARDLHASLLEVKPDQVVTELRRLTTNRRPETAALAARSLFMLGDLSSVAGDSNVLLNPKLQAYWEPIVDDLRSSLAMDPARVSKLQGLWSNSYGEKENLMWGLLAGFSPEQLASGGDKQLVEALASPAMDQRVLGAFHLKRILGNDMDYFADRQSPEAMQNIRRLQSNGKLRYATPPAPLPEASRP